MHELKNVPKNHLLDNKKRGRKKKKKNKTGLKRNTIEASLQFTKYLQAAAFITTPSRYFLGMK